MIELLNNEFATLIVYPEKRIVHHRFKKYIYGEAFQEVMTKGADIFIEHHCNKWLSDDRENAALRKEDIEWGQKFWENRILEQGWKFWALVMPKKVIGQINMRGIVDRYKSLGVTVQIFDDPDKAMQWLEAQE